jgi:hypothetical protein
MANITRFTSALWDADAFYIESDFDTDQLDALGVDTITDTGTVLMGDEANGVVTLTPSDGTVADNDEAYFATPNENFLFAANRELYFRARVQFSEVVAGAANVAFGCANAVAGDLLIDDGGGLRASGSLLAIYKVDGSSVWRATARSNSVVTITVSTEAAVAATWYDLEIICVDAGNGNHTVTYKVDGKFLKDTNGSVIRHVIPVASATEMQMFLGVKLGAATNNDVLKCDWWYGAQTR